MSQSVNLADGTAYMTASNDSFTKPAPMRQYHSSTQSASNIDTYQSLPPKHQTLQAAQNSSSNIYLNQHRSESFKPQHANSLFQQQLKMPNGAKQASKVKLRNSKYDIYLG